MQNLVKQLPEINYKIRSIIPEDFLFLFKKRTKKETEIIQTNYAYLHEKSLLI